MTAAEAAIRRFSISVPERELTALADRLDHIRWPPPAPGPAWQRGTDQDYLRSLMGYWRQHYDWRAAERRLNAFGHFVAEFPDVRLHFLHHRAASGNGLPLLLLHGWPSTFAEFLPLVPLLTDPAAHGLDGPGFDLVIPSLPGYCFSSRPARCWTMLDSADLFGRLMRQLGYRRYGVHGGDFGSGIGTFLALRNPEVIGLHLSNIELSPWLGDGARPLTPDEQAFVDREEEWLVEEGGYQAVQSSRPQSLAYGLTDSPVGLAGWLLEKWRAWSDSGGDLDARFSRDFLLTTLSLFWHTNSIGTSLQDYYDNRAVYDQVGPADRVRVPTAIAMFGNEFVDDGTMPKEWVERLYEVRRWRTMPRGGHFAAVEEPNLLAADLTESFTELFTGLSG